MPTVYTKITKPSGTTYSNQNAGGKEQYDQATITYDDPLVFYDGTDYGLYTSVAKPSGTVYTNVVKPT